MIRPYSHNETPPRPDPVFPDEDEYKVERILDHRDVRDQRKYLVLWLGYLEFDDS